MIFENPILNILGGFVTAFTLVFISIPSIVTVAQRKKLYVVPEGRHVHEKITPTLGGVAIFSGLLISLGVWVSTGFTEFQYISAALLVMFFIGVKDDILIIAPFTKMMGQIVAAGIIVFFGNIRFTNLHGFNGIHEIHYLTSAVLTIFVIIVIINALNLIDGIDGLASGIGILSTFTFGAWFLLVEQYNYALLSAVLIGSLLAFFYFNVYSSKNKLFMGDTGSLVLGLVLSILVIKFNEVNIDSKAAYAIQSAPSVSFGILFVPLFDMLRVMFIRFFTHRPLFQPDKRHLHHLLLSLGMSHKRATFTILFVNALFVAFVMYYSQFTSIRRLMLVILIIGTVLTSIPHFILNKRVSQGKPDETPPNKPDTE